MVKKPSKCVVCHSDLTSCEALAGGYGADGKDYSFVTAAYRLDCNKCKTYALSLQDVIALYGEDDWTPPIEGVGAILKDEEKRLQALLEERRLQGLPPPWLRLSDKEYRPFFGSEKYFPVRPESLLTEWPTSFSERRDRALMNIRRMTSCIGGDVIVNPDKEYGQVFGINSTEAGFVLESLVKSGFLNGLSDRLEDGFSTRISPTGWDRIAEIETRGKNPRLNPVFVAMAFGIDDDPKVLETTQFMDKLFDDVIQPAVRAAGFKCQRVDRDHHTDYIMDKVMAMTRIAPFVVADFTLHSRGVYFEAGFARGLDLRVVHTCRESHKKQVHFDTAQINTIFWKDPADLKQRLTDRIVGLMGQGPYSIEGGAPSNKKG